MASFPLAVGHDIDVSKSDIMMSFASRDTMEIVYGCKGHNELAWLPSYACMRRLSLLAGAATLAV